MLRIIYFYIAIYALGLIYCLFLFSQNTISIEATVDYSNKDIFAVYYDVGNGFNQMDVCSTNVNNINIKYKVRLLCNLEKLYKIRIDIGSQQGIYKIYELRIDNIVFDSEELFSNIANSNDINLIEKNFDYLLIRTVGNDPYIIIDSNSNIISILNKNNTILHNENNKNYIFIFSLTVLLFLLIHLVIFINQKNVIYFFCKEKINRRNHIRSCNKIQDCFHFRKIIYYIWSIYTKESSSVLRMGFIVHKYKYYLKPHINHLISLRINKLLLNSTVYVLIIFLIFLWQFSQNIYFATNIKEFISPDEPHHLIVSQLYKNFQGMPPLNDNSQTYSLGALSSEPFLYHYFFGKLLHFKPNYIEDLLYLRIINVILSILFFWSSIYFINAITRDRILKLVVLLVLVNIPMLQFMQAMVSYDNFINLLALLSFIASIGIIKGSKKPYALLLFSIWSLGLLIKKTFAPIIIFEIIFIFILKYKLKIYRNVFSIITIKNIIAHVYYKVIQRIYFNYKYFKIVSLFLLIVLLISAAYNLYLFGGNLLKYNSMYPSHGEVLGLEIVNSKYPASKVYRDLVETAHQRPLFSFKKYSIMHFEHTVQTIISISGHKTLYQYKYIVKITVLIICISLLMLFVKIIFERNNNELLFIIGIASSYYLIVFYVIYKAYLGHHAFGASLQGRYIFPVIVPIIYMLIYGLLYKTSNIIKTFYFLSFVFLLPMLSFNFFLNNVLSDWLK